MTPYFPDSLLGITKRGRKKTVRQTMVRFPSAKDIEVVEKDPTKAISSAFDGVLKADMTLSVLAEKYRRGAREDVEGLRAELSKARTEIHGLKEELNSARKTVKTAKKELADAQEAGTSRIQALETQLKEAKEEKELIAKELKERKDKLAQMKSDLAEAQRKVEQSQEKVIVEWKKTPACADFQSEIGYMAFEARIEDALTHMQVAFTTFGLQDSYSKVRGKVKDLVREAEEEEQRKLLAEEDMTEE